MKKFISILGSTGSVGISTLRIIDKKKKLFKVNLLSANSNYKLICNQIIKYKPNLFLIFDRKIFLRTKLKFKNNKTKIINKIEDSSSIKKNHITISAIPGIAGLEPTVQMIKKSQKILMWRVIGFCYS